jgi:hypothetical protein
LASYLLLFQFIMIKNKPPMNKLKYMAAVLIGIAGLGLHQAQATAINPPFLSDLGVGNDGIESYTGPYGHMSITLSGQTATVTLTSNTVAGNTYLFGGNSHSFGVEVNASSFTSGGLAGGRLGGFTGTLGFGGSQNLNGFGIFNLTVDDSDGFKDAFDNLSFTITNTSATPWLNASQVLTTNSGGFDAAGHVFVATTGVVKGAPAYINSDATGFAAEVPGKNGVPDGGSTMMLLGAALSVLGMARRYLKS